MSANQAKLKKKILQLKRLTFAQQSMQTVMEGCENAISSSLTANERTIVSAGIAALYASPFTEGNGLGMLDKEFTEFKERNLADYHDNLMACRHRLFSHRDMLLTGTNSAGTVERLHQLLIVIEPGGKCFLDSTRIKWSTSVFSKVKELAEFQCRRLGKKIEVLFPKVASQVNLPPGRHILG
jgi:hypothetical protein